jgi:hypothetical protein
MASTDPVRGRFGYVDYTRNATSHKGVERQRAPVDATRPALDERRRPPA